jgi:hypothetical protein
MADAADFQKNHGKPGWVYVTRNDLMREDLYKVGCTAQQHPETRTTQLNSEQRNGTSRIGFFNLLFAVAVFDAQGCESALLRRLDVLKESRGKEFVNAPLELILGELLHIQKIDLQTVSASAICPSCSKLNRLAPHPYAKQFCGHCSAPFVPDSPSSLRHATINDKHTLVFTALDEVKPSHHSPLAVAFMQMRDSVRLFLDGDICKEELVRKLEHWLDKNPPLDRTPLLYQKPPPKPRRIRSIKAAPRYKTQKGWLECPQCLSSIKPDDDGLAICLECGWSNDSD